MFVGIAVLLVGAYLLGSVNPALMVARFRGVDIREVGSGNPGASNVLRALGKGPAATVYLLDLLKGFVPALVGLLIWSSEAGAVAGLGAVIGHCYPIYHRFRGGKGVATAGGALLAVSPPVMLIMGLVYAITLKLWKISAVGSLVVAVVSIPALWITGQEGATVAWFTSMMLLIIYRHRSNLSRISSGTENRF